jgi:hypothetical protein
VIKFKAGRTVLSTYSGPHSQPSHQLLSVQELAIPCLLLSGCHLQFNLAKDAVKALNKVHGIQYIFGSISTTLCE